jgi:hypothetical protein
MFRNAIFLAAAISVSACDYASPRCYRYFYYPADEHGFRYDPKEEDPKHASAFEETAQEVQLICAEWLGRLGAYQCTFPETKRILKQRYSIDWKTPEELNPCVVID